MRAPKVVVKKEEPKEVVRKRKPSKIMLSVTLGLAGALALGATFTGIQAVEKHDQFRDETVDANVRAAARDSGKKYQQATDILAAGTVVMATIGVSYYFLSYRPRAEKMEREQAYLIAPVVSEEKVGVTISGAF